MSLFFRKFSEGDFPAEGGEQFTGFFRRQIALAAEKSAERRLLETSAPGDFAD
jgi:hypothetical protein